LVSHGWLPVVAAATARSPVGARYGAPFVIAVCVEACKEAFDYQVHKCFI
jgi:hypothetical protein